MKKILILFVKKLDGFLSSASIKIVVLTGKSKYPIHPKHLIEQKIWFAKYLKKNDQVLDLGCGAGTLTQQVAKHTKRVIGVEIDQKLLTFAKLSSSDKKIANTNFIYADLNEKFHFKDNYFDKIICHDVLEHLTKRDFALKEIRRVLKKGGMLFLVTDNPDNSWKKLQKSVGIFHYADSDHKYEYPKNEILKKLKDLNFKVLSISPVTYETPLKGLIDLAGSFSLSLYKSLRKWRERMNNKFPEETVGFRIIAKF